MKYLLLAPALLLGACATAPENIAAASLSSNAFMGQSCSSLNMNLVATSQKLENLSATQRSAASGDALGVFLIGLPISSMSGGDKEADISIAKAELQQIQSAISVSGC